MYKQVLKCNRLLGFNLYHMPLRKEGVEYTGICKSTNPLIFFSQSETTITSRKVNVNTIVTSNFVQIVKKASFLITLAQNISNNSPHIWV